MTSVCVCFCVSFVQVLVIRGSRDNPGILVKAEWKLMGWRVLRGHRGRKGSWHLIVMPWQAKALTERSETGMDRGGHGWGGHTQRPSQCSDQTCHPISLPGTRSCGLTLWNTPGIWLQAIDDIPTTRVIWGENPCWRTCLPQFWSANVWQAHWSTPAHWLWDKHVHHDSLSTIMVNQRWPSGPIMK